MFGHKKSSMHLKEVFKSSERKEVMRLLGRMLLEGV